MSEALGVSEYDSDDIDSIRFDNPEESADIDENREAFLEANFPQEMLECLIRSFGPEIVKNEIYTILADYFERCEQLGVECSNEVMSIVTNCINDFGKGSEIEANANFAAGELMTESIKIHHNDETKMAEMLLLASCLRYEAEMKAQQYYRNRISASGSAGGYELENLIAAEKLRFFKGVTAVLRVTKGLEDLEQLKELVALVISVGRINPFGVEKIMH